MKKHALLAMAVIMVLGSIKAMAMSDEEIMNQQTKIDAMVINQGGGKRLSYDSIEVEHGINLIAASQKNFIRNTRAKSFQVSKALEQIGSQDIFKMTSIGQLDDTAEKILIESQRTESSMEIQSLWDISDDLDKELNNIIKTYKLVLKDLTAQEQEILHLFD